MSTAIMTAATEPTPGTTPVRERRDVRRTFAQARAAMLIGDIPANSVAVRHLVAVQVAQARAPGTEPVSFCPGNRDVDRIWRRISCVPMTDRELRITLKLAQKFYRTRRQRHETRALPLRSRHSAWIDIPRLGAYFPMPRISYQDGPVRQTADILAYVPPTPEQPHILVCTIVQVPYLVDCRYPYRSVMSRDVKPAVIDTRAMTITSLNGTYPICRRALPAVAGHAPHIGRYRGYLQDSLRRLTRIEAYLKRSK